MIKTLKPDVIIGMGILNAFLSARLAKLFKVPFVYYLIDSLHTLIPESYLQPVGRFFERRTLQSADQVLAINKQLGRYAKRLGAHVKPKIISAGIDKTRFNPDLDGTLIRRELMIQDNEMVLFFMGWLYDFSGLREVAQSISETNSDVRLLILGKGDLYDELKELGELSNGSKIIVHDWVSYENVPKYLSAADICILPAHLNSIMRNIVPIKVYEYLACGKPVIATKLPGVMREFGEGKGLVYIDRPENVLGEARTIFGDKKRYNNLSDAALRFSDTCDWKNRTRRFVDILHKTISQSIGTDCIQNALQSDVES
jgi:glycosyltransferase involved in cell wall biosynthesis